MDNPTFQRVTLEADGKVVMNYSPTPAQVIPEAYPLAMPRDCMYGRAGEWADLIEGPDGPAYLATIAVAASNDIRCSVHTIIPRVYVAHLGPTKVGKSTCTDRAVKVAPKTGNIVHQFPASLPGLAKILHPGTGKDAPDLDAPGYVPPTVTFCADELEALLQALKTPGSGAALDATLRTLWSKSEAGSGDKKGCHRIKADINILGNLPVANAQEFAKMFGVGTRGGLYSRFLFSVFPDRWRWNHISWKAPVVDGWQLPDAVIDVSALDDTSAMDANWIPPAPRDTRPAPYSNLVQVPEYVEPALQAWIDEGGTNSNENRDRLAEQVIRVAVITASCNGDSEITRECLQAALKFGEWQERIAKTYQPALSDEKSDQFAAALEAELRARQKGRPAKWFEKWSRICNEKSWYKTYSTCWRKVKTDLIAADLIICDVKMDPNWEGKMVPKKDESKVRWNEEV